MSWEPTTDDDIPAEMGKVATAALATARELGAGQADIRYKDKEGEDRMWTVTVAIGPVDTVAVFIDWEDQTVVTAWAK